MPNIAPAILLSGVTAFISSDYRQLGPLAVLLLFAAATSDASCGNHWHLRLLRWQTLVQVVLLVGIAAWGIAINHDRMAATPTVSGTETAAVPKAAGGLMSSRGYGAPKASAGELSQRVDALKARSMQGGGSNGQQPPRTLPPSRLPGIGPNAKALPPGLVPTGPLPPGVKAATPGAAGVPK